MNVNNKSKLRKDNKLAEEMASLQLELPQDGHWKICTISDVINTFPRRPKTAIRGLLGPDY